MGLFGFIKRLLGFSETKSEEWASPSPESIPETRSTVARTSASQTPAAVSQQVAAPVSSITRVSEKRPQPIAEPEVPRVRASLEKFRYQSSLVETHPSRESVERKPYRFAVQDPGSGKYLDLSQDADERWLDYYGLPVLKTPDDLAEWLKIPIGKLAWLTGHFKKGERSVTPGIHYVPRWIPKRSGGWRLLEAPKPLLKQIQIQILREILDRVPAHSSAHGFVAGRSIVTNAAPHTGQRFLLKMDLENFYANVSYPRIVAIFRSLGFSREVGIWLARLTTTSIPWNSKRPISDAEMIPYGRLHLPQGAPTSPALANLSAFSLDVRLTGLAEAYHIRYTRYADDLTFSGTGTVVPALREIIPLVQKIIHSERFVFNRDKLKVIRNHQRQSVTGVIVNQRTNICRRDYDQLKAILHNCVKQGPASQNRDQHENFSAHLLGRIVHVLHLNPDRGDKLLNLYEQIQWDR